MQPMLPGFPLLWLSALLEPRCRGSKGVSTQYVPERVDARVVSGGTGEGVSSAFGSYAVGPNRCDVT